MSLLEILGPAEGAKKSSDESSKLIVEEDSNAQALKDVFERRDFERGGEEYQILQIWIKCESQRQMHRLSSEYFLFREFYYHFLLLTLITMASGIMAFFASMSTEIFDVQTKDWLSVAVGVCSIVSVAIQNFAKNQNYRTRAQMHKIASFGLKKLTDSIDFAQIDPNKGIDENGTGKNSSKPPKNQMEVAATNENDEQEDDVDGEEPTAETPSRTVAVETPGLALSAQQQVNEYKRVYEQCLQSCTSPIPIEISQPFILVDARLNLGMRNRKNKSRIYQTFGGSGQEAIYGSMYNEVYCTLSNSWFWPMYVLSPDRAIKKALETVKDSRDSIFGFLGNDIENGV